LNNLIISTSILTCQTCNVQHKYCTFVVVMNDSNIVSVCSGIGPTIRELFTVVAIVFDHAIQSKTLIRPIWAMASTILWVGLFELNSLAVFDRALTVVHQVKYHSRPS